MTDVLRFADIPPDAVDAVGGKGLSLGRLAAAGLPVPPGFCLTTAAYRRARGQDALPADLRGQVARAYADLGGGAVAVRSSATVEDGEAASFAGQQETVLGVEGDAAVAAAVVRCWRSLDSERARAYRRKQNVDEAAVAMAVVVQRLVPSEVSGVLFTRDPTDPTGLKMMAEAAWGLGESVVSGRVTPDRFHLDRATGRLRDQHISLKAVQVGPGGEQPVPEGRQTVACLTEDQLRDLAALGRRIEDLYGDARDIEWAWAGGQFWILQARPITTAGAYEREQVRREEIAALRPRAAPRGTVWARYNLAEILPTPTPLTWAIVRRFMSGRGGEGLLLRDLGYDPDPAFDAEGSYDLICGRPYVNLTRDALKYFRGAPLGYDFSALKAEPSKALYPTPGLDPQAVTWRYVFQVPGLLWRQMRSNRRLAEGPTDDFFLTQFHQFRDRARAEAGTDLGRLEPPQLLDRLALWTTATLDDFARVSLRPTAHADFAMGQLRQGLTPGLGAARADQAVKELLNGVHPEAEADLAGGLEDLAAGRLSREAFLARFGHRGPGEMELANPRWAERPELLHVAGGSARHHVEPPAETWARIAGEAKLTAGQKAALERHWADARRFMALREAGKNYLMMGYAEIRRTLVELGRRYRLGDDVFFLTPDDLPHLAGDRSFDRVVRQRKQRRQLALSLEAPQVIFSDDLEAIGRPLPAPADGALRGTPLSAGVAEGPALVLTEPTAGDEPAGFVLVCPSTDPAWGPLCLKACALVMETGGLLSHGAIVAREYGLPAVVGIPDLPQRFRTGQRLRVDGNTGVVQILGEGP